VVILTGRWSKCGVISPRFGVQLKDLGKWPRNLLRSRRFGIQRRGLVVGTSVERSSGGRSQLAGVSIRLASRWCPVRIGSKTTRGGQVRGRLWSSARLSLRAGGLNKSCGHRFLGLRVCVFVAPVYKVKLHKCLYINCYSFYIRLTLPFCVPPPAPL